MKPGIVFLGKGTRISPVEKATNGKYTRAIICPYMAAIYDPDEEKLMFCDNLDAQTTSSFLDLLRQVGCSRFLMPPETTDLVQAVDDGLGRLVKLQVGK